MVQGIYFNEETRSFSTEQREFTDVGQMKALKPVYETYKSKGGKLGFADWVKKNGYGVDNAIPMKHGLTRAEAKKQPIEIRNAVAKSMKDSRNRKGSVNVDRPSMHSAALKAKMNVMSPKGKAAMIGIAGTAAAGAGAYAIHKAIQKRKAKKAAAKAE